jgi:hypothetical protein
MRPVAGSGDFYLKVQHNGLGGSIDRWGALTLSIGEGDRTPRVFRRFKDPFATRFPEKISPVRMRSERMLTRSGDS